MNQEGSRGVSTAVFNNSRWIDVVLALDAWTGTPITQQLANDLNVMPDLVKKVLVRLEAAHLAKPLPREGGARGPVPWEVQRGPEWSALVEVCAALANRAAYGPQRE